MFNKKIKKIAAESVEIGDLLQYGTSQIEIVAIAHHRDPKRIDLWYRYTLQTLFPIPGEFCLPVNTDFLVNKVA